MEIERMEYNTCRVEQVRSGNWFELGGSVLLRTDEFTSEGNIVCVGAGDGGVQNYPPTIKVTPCNFKLVEVK